MGNIVFVGDDGTITGVESSLTKTLGLPDRKRVSRVEPVNGLVRFFFYLLRNRVKDDSVFSEFTRRWPCVWQARVFDGPTFGPFKTRQAAIQAETDWLNSQLERQTES